MEKKDAPLGGAAKEVAGVAAAWAVAGAGQAGK